MGAAPAALFQAVPSRYGQTALGLLYAARLDGELSAPLLFSSLGE